MSTLRVDNLQGQTAGTNRYVVQVVSVDYGTETTSTSSSMADTGLTASITPVSTNNKILVLVHQQAKALDGAGRMSLVRDSTTLEEQYFGESEGGDWYGTIDVTKLDSPATTSSVTYKTQQRTNGAGTVGVNSPILNACTMTLMEIAQ